MELQQIIYTSHSLVPMDKETLVALLDQSRRDNTAAGITGLLLHADGSFVQTIEGEFAAVHALLAKIEHDPRHGGLVLISDEPIERRSFGDWSMAFREISRSDAERLAGFQHLPGANPEQDRDFARRLMATFGDATGLSR
jgi:Sensors of blue-light using FAD